MIRCLTDTYKVPPRVGDDDDDPLSLPRIFRSVFVEKLGIHEEAVVSGALSNPKRLRTVPDRVAMYTIQLVRGEETHPAMDTMVRK